MRHALYHRLGVRGWWGDGCLQVMIIGVHFYYMRVGDLYRMEVGDLYQRKLEVEHIHVFHIS